MRKRTIQKHQKRLRKTIKSGGSDTETPKRFRCCICKNIVGKNKVFETTRCNVKGPYYRHKICSNCWWGTPGKPGFAHEYSKHECPGCKDNISPVKRPSKKPTFIDLTEE